MGIRPVWCGLYVGDRTGMEAVSRFICWSAIEMASIAGWEVARGLRDYSRRAQLPHCRLKLHYQTITSVPLPAAYCPTHIHGRSWWYCRCAENAWTASPEAFPPAYEILVLSPRQMPKYRMPRRTFVSFNEFVCGCLLRENIFKVMAVINTADMSAISSLPSFTFSLSP